MSEEANHTAKTQRLKRPTVATYLAVIEAIERQLDGNDGADLRQK
jgi:hypothetical protein